MRRKRPTLKEVDQLREQISTALQAWANAARGLEAEKEAHGRTLNRLRLTEASRDRAERAVILKTRMPDAMPANAAGMARCRIEIKNEVEVQERIGGGRVVLPGRESVTGELEVLYLGEGGDAAMDGPHLTLVAGDSRLRVAETDRECQDEAHPLREPNGVSLRLQFAGLQTGELSAVQAARGLMRAMRDGIVFIESQQGGSDAHSPDH